MSYWNLLYLLLIRFWTQIDLDSWELGYLKALRSSITLLIISTSAFPAAIQRERKTIITLLRCELNCNLQFYGTIPAWIAFGNNWNKMVRDLPIDQGETEDHLKTQTLVALQGKLTFWSYPVLPSWYKLALWELICILT